MIDCNTHKNGYDILYLKKYFEKGIFIGELIFGFSSSWYMKCYKLDITLFRKAPFSSRGEGYFVGELFVSKLWGKYFWQKVTAFQISQGISNGQIPDIFITI
jgi:hypothetical protein